jgi:hypothetical protein
MAQSEIKISKFPQPKERRTNFQIQVQIKFIESIQMITFILEEKNNKLC